MAPKSDRYEDEFTDVAVDPWWWRSNAETLKEAADVLWSRYRAWKAEATRHIKSGSRAAPPRGGQFWRPAILLLGLAMENLLKATIVCMTPSVVQDAQLRWGGDGHDQVSLARDAKLDALVEWQRSPADNHMFRLLTQFVRWAGRYPVRKKATPESGPILGSTTWAEACSLYDRLFRATRFCFRSEPRATDRSSPTKGRLARARDARPRTQSLPAICARSLRTKASRPATA